ncbi:MAG: glucosamine-6-phosphate deaminase [Anaerolineaceae bacterium]
MDIQVFESTRKLAAHAASLFIACINEKPNAVLGFATGSTPVETYRELISLNKAGRVDFSKVTSINLDEYVGLSSEDTQSYIHFMKENLFDSINISPANTHILNGKAQNLLNECLRYDALIVEKGGIDLQLLGIGPNGHIAFNEPCDYFPMTSHLVNLSEETIRANTRFFESMDEVPRQALTMGTGQIFMAKKIALLATGEGKAAAITSALLGPVTPMCPASILQLHSNVTFLLDSSAASGILGAPGVYYKEFH